jgi:Putative peptidoglycan binding domain
MLKTLRHITILFVSCFLLAGCVSGGLKKITQSNKPAMKIVLPDRIFTTRKSTPVDIKMVCAAVMNNLRHRSKTPFVSFSKDAKEQLQEADFNYDGFDVTNIDITGFDAKQIEKKKSEGLVEGVIHFKDFVNRRASTYFAVKYSKTPKGITINKAGITIIPPVFPRLEAYFVPLDAFDNNQLAQSYLELYAFALTNSIDMNPTPEEVESYQAYQNLPFMKKITARSKSKKMKTVVMLFSLDRLSESCKFDVDVSEGSHKNIVDPIYINSNGWPVTIVAGEFYPDSWNVTFDVKAYYTPPKQKKILIGKFSNQKNYSKYQVAQNNNDHDQGPIAMGSIFLNPSVKDDAKLIQHRLGELGYYNMAVDGSFGKGSKKSLQKFKKENNLNNDTNWDIKTQKELFKGSNR